MVAAHPFRGAHELISLDAEGGLIVKVDKASRMAIFDWVDAIEIFNGRAPDWELKLSSVVCDNLPIPGMGGSDAHNTTSVGDCVTVFQNRVANEKEFLEEIKAGRYYAQHRRLNIFYPDNGKYQRKRSRVLGSEVQG